MKRRTLKSVTCVSLVILMLAGVFGMTAGAAGEVIFDVVDYDTTILDMKTVDTLTLYLDKTFTDKTADWEDVTISLYSEQGDSWVSVSPAITFTLVNDGTALALKFNKALEPKEMYRIHIPENCMVTAEGTSNAAKDIFLYGANLLGNKRYTPHPYGLLLQTATELLEDSFLAKILNFTISGVEFKLSFIFYPLFVIAAIPYLFFSHIS